MEKKFIGIKGRHVVGKTKTLNDFTDNNKGVKLAWKSTRRICSRNGKTVFIRSSSPNERAKNKLPKAIQLLNEDLDFFEKIAENCNVTYFVMVMALTQIKPDTTQEIIQAIRDRRYDYREIIKNSKDHNILEGLENHEFFT